MVEIEPGQAPDPEEKARGGEIILRSRGHRIIFIAGLLALFLIVLLLEFWR